MSMAEHSPEKIVGRLAHAHEHDVGKVGASRHREEFWLIMAPASRLPWKPPCPVMQNLQPMRQPAWLETHRVARSRSGMKTASTSRPPYAFKEVFGGSVGALRPQLWGLRAPRCIPSTVCGEPPWEVGHSLDGIDALLIEPCSHLSGGKAPQSLLRQQPAAVPRESAQAVSSSVEILGHSLHGAVCGHSTVQYRVHTVEYWHCHVEVRWFMSWIHLVP